MPAEAPGADLSAFVALVRRKGRELYRDLPWRRTRDPYAVWLSEVMLQQTQVARVDGRWQRWLSRFPSVEALAAAETADVLDEWQGMGYNRRALALQRAAGVVVSEHGGSLPQDERSLLALPGIGPATAAGIRAFAWDLPALYLETNVRAVFLHELFPDAEQVPDKVLLPYVAQALPKEDIRGWYYALLDYGAYLKKAVPNPSRRSKTHVKQSRFEGSRRQKRAALVRILLDARAAGLPGLEPHDISAALAECELRAGRPAPEEALVGELLAELEYEGFCKTNGCLVTA